MMWHQEWQKYEPAAAALYRLQLAAAAATPHQTTVTVTRSVMTTKAPIGTNPSVTKSAPSPSLRCCAAGGTANCFSISTCPQPPAHPQPRAYTLW